MQNKYLNYRIIVEKESQNENDVYVAYAPSLGISDFGKTIEQAVANIQTAMQLYIDTLIELDQPLPEEDTDDYFVTTRKVEINTLATHSL